MTDEQNHAHLLASLEALGFRGVLTGCWVRVGEVFTHAPGASPGPVWDTDFKATNAVRKKADEARRIWESGGVTVFRTDLERLCYGVALKIISGLEHSCVLEEDGKKIAYDAVERFLKEREVSNDLEEAVRGNSEVSTRADT